jgi:integrase
LPGETKWDAGKGAVTGFGIRRRRGDAVTYVLKYRVGGGRRGRQRWITIGRHGSPWTPEAARQEARRILGAVADGNDPAAEKQAARAAMTFDELCDEYVRAAETGRLMTRRGRAKKPSTLEIDRGRIERHLRPLLGRLAVRALTRADIEQAMNDIIEGKTAGRTKTKPRGIANVRGGRGTAARTVGLLGGILSFAVRRGLRPDNPVHGVIRPADGQRERRLSDDEYAAFGAALRAAEVQSKIWPVAVAATRFLALTGWRRGEALNLRWSDIDLSRRTATLSDTKTGRSVRPLSHAASNVLRCLPRVGTDDLVFPSTRGSGTMAGFPKLWERIAKLGELPSDVTPHVLRHSFASIAADLGLSELAVAALLGHRSASVTRSYVHMVDAVLLAAADTVANRIVGLMGEAKLRADVIPHPRAAAG